MVDRVGQQLGNYRLTRLLGHGGFADVYLGEHIRLGTQAAIKVLQTRLASQEMETLQNEARIIARLEHAHIVRVLDFDVMEGTPFLVMSYAPGGTLRLRHLRGVAMSVPTIMTYVQQIADALQYAHDEKVVHRDIKPENVLLGRRDEVLLSDFGIATIVQSSVYQNAQNMAGTVSYMAPEQIQGKPRPASDQYALGVMVYEWVSGQRPFQGSFTEIATQQVLALPSPLREKIPTISMALEHVIMKALEKDPHKRFASVRAFADALIQAGQEQEASPSVHAAEILSSQPTVPPGQAILTEKLRTDSSLSSMGTGTLPVKYLPSRGALFCLYQGHTESVSSVAWSLDGSRIASASDDRTVQIWTVPTGSLVMKYQSHSSSVSSVAWSPDGSRIASASADQTVQIWEAITGRSLLTYRGHIEGVWALAWSPNGDCIASVSDDQTIQVWDVLTGELVFTCSSDVDSVWAVAWSPNDAYLTYQDKTSMIHVCDSVEGRRLRTYRGHKNRVWTIAWSPDGSTIASGGEDETMQIWTAKKGRKLLTYRGHSAYVIVVAWSPDGAYIASAGDDQTVQIWVAATGKEVFTYRGHSSSVIAVAWSPDGAYIASAGEDQTVQVWAASP